MLFVDFDPVINFGTFIIALFIGIGTLISLMYGVRYKASYEASRAFSEDLQKRVEYLDGRLDEERELKHKALTDVANLRLRTDITPLISAQNELSSKIASVQEEFNRQHNTEIEILREISDLLRIRD